MSGVDVLAVMERAVVFAERTGSAEDLAKFREARAAVADLIVELDALRITARDFDEVLRKGHLLCDCGKVDCRTTRLDAVLARFTGAHP